MLENEIMMSILRQNRMQIQVLQKVSHIAEQLKDGFLKEKCNMQITENTYLWPLLWTRSKKNKELKSFFSIKFCLHFIGIGIGINANPGKPMSEFLLQYLGPKFGTKSEKGRLVSFLS